MAKSRPNKLDPFAERLREWTAEGKTLKQMQDALREDGCACSLSSLSDFLARRRQASLEEAMFAQIASGGAMNRQLDSAFKENPAPDIERLIQVTKTLVMSLQVKGVADPRLLSLANAMQQTVLNYVSGRTKAELEARKLEQGERKLAILEAKAKQADAAKGLLEDGELSATQRESRMRELFGMAAKAS
jgi:DNA-binding phage protein